MIIYIIVLSAICSFLAIRNFSLSRYTKDAYVMLDECRKKMRLQRENMDKANKIILEQNDIIIKLEEENKQ